MKFRLNFLPLVLLLFAIFASVPKAKAQEVDYVANAVAALQTSNIYVHPGTPGTDYNTESSLKKFLTDSDQIVLIILPAEALSGTVARSVAQAISVGLKNQKTIGLAIGDELIGYSMVLPEGIASDKMYRAGSVSSDPVTALITYTQNIHSWQSKNPQPTPTPSPEPTPTPRPTMVPIEIPKIDTSTSGGKISVGFIALLILVFTFWLVIKLVPVLMRHSKFTPSSNSISTNKSLLAKVENRQVVTELGKALRLGLGLIDIYRASSKYTGIGEDIFPVMLQNMTLQLQALIDHESGEQPLEDQYEATIENLLNYDDLFKVLQKNDPKAIELMAANYNSKNTMISHMGYLPTKSK